MKVFAYARTSTTQQHPENQLVELREVAKRNGWTIEKEYCDQLSGAKGRNERPEFDAMLKSAMRKEADLVMFWSVDRASRNLSHLVEMMEDLDAMNVGMYFHQQAISTTTPSGKAMIQMAGVFASFERSMLKERILASHERAKAEGKKIGRPTMLNASLIASVELLREQKVPIKKIAKKLKIGVGTVYKVLQREKDAEVIKRLDDLEGDLDYAK